MCRNSASGGFHTTHVTANVRKGSKPHIARVTEQPEDISKIIFLSGMVHDIRSCPRSHEYSVLGLPRAVRPWHNIRTTRIYHRSKHKISVLFHCAAQMECEPSVSLTRHNAAARSKRLRTVWNIIKKYSTKTKMYGQPDGTGGGTDRQVHASFCA